MIDSGITRRRKGRTAASTLYTRVAAFGLINPGILLRHVLLPFLAGLLSGRAWTGGVSFGAAAAAAGAYAGINPFFLALGGAAGSLASGNPAGAAACAFAACSVYILKRLDKLPPWGPSLLAGTCAAAAALMARPSTLYDTVLVFVGGFASLGACVVFSIALRSRISRRLVLSPDEAVCAALSAVILLIGAADIRLLGFAPAVMLMLFVVMLMSYVQGAMAGAAVGVLAGAALYLPAGNGALMGALGLCGLCCGAFRPLKRMGCAVGFGLGGLLAAVAMGPNAPIPAMEAGAAAMLLMFVPPDMLASLRARIERVKETPTPTRNAEDTRALLTERMAVFTESYKELAQAFSQALEGRAQEEAKPTGSYPAGEGRALVGRQLEAVAEAVEGLSDELSMPVEYLDDMAQAIALSADKRALRASDIIARRVGGRLMISLTTRPCDGSGRCATDWEPLLGNAAGCAMRAASDVCVRCDGRCKLNFVERERFLTVTGTAVMSGSSGPCGDAHLFRPLDGGRAMFLVCDGMGMGEGALTEATIAVSLIERMLVSGFKLPLALDTVNELLMARNEERFSTVDLCLTDLNKGEIKFVKIGASFSWIKRGDLLIHVSAGALPLGIVHGVKPSVATYPLHDGDVIIMMSDGVADADEEDPEGWARNILSTLDARNPQEMAEGILAAARAQAVHPDDMTVMVTRIFERRDTV